MLSCLFIAALWPPAGKGLESWLSCMLCCVIVTFPRGVLGRLWCLIESIPDLCLLTYFDTMQGSNEGQRLYFSNDYEFLCIKIGFIYQIV